MGLIFNFWDIKYYIVLYPFILCKIAMYLCIEINPKKNVMLADGMWRKTRNTFRNQWTLIALKDTNYDISLTV